MERMNEMRRVVLFLFVVWGAGYAGRTWAEPPRSETSWRRFDGCRLLANPANDGDSFHVLLPPDRRGRRAEKIFRLCYVDTPEVEMSLPDRVRDQAAYWGITTNRAVRLGKEAARFTKALLEKQPFTVYTQFRDAKGRSRLPRYFAMIRVGETWLSLALVENGLARIYGYRPDLPDGTRWKDYLARLKQAEEHARRAGKGGFRKALDDNKVTVRLDRFVAVFSTNKVSRRLGVLKPGTRVEILESLSSFRVHIRFRGPDGSPMDAVCARSDLGLIRPTEE